VPSHARNPLESVRSHPEPQPSWTATGGTLGRLLEAVREGMRTEQITVRDGQALLLIGLLARRPTEVLRRRVEDFDMRSETMRIPRSKNGKPMIVPLVGEALEVACDAIRREPEGFVFQTYSGQPLSASGLAAPWRRVMDIAAAADGLDERTDGRRFVVRDMRALGVTAMLRAELPVQVICKVTGHSPQMVARYARLTVEDARKAIEKMHEGENITTTKATAPSFGEVLDELIKKKFKSRAEAARALGVSRQTLHNWLEGSVAIESLPVARAREIAEVLDTDLAGLGIR
jgi:DNA-binding XRE family transcriptional regulator